MGSVIDYGALEYELAELEVQLRLVQARKHLHSKHDQLTHGRRGAFWNSLGEVEEKIRRLPIERAVVLDSQGNIVVDKTGTHDTVSFSQEEADKMKGHTLTHNHPRGTSFSSDDIEAMFVAQLTEIRVTSEKYRYSMMRPLDTTMKQVLVARDKHETQIRRDFANRIREGKVTLEQAEADHFHEVWTRVGKELGMIYDRQAL